MGKINNQFKHIIIDEIRNSIDSGTSVYYAVTADPTEVANVVDVSNNDIDRKNSFSKDILFGKKLSSSDIRPMIENNIWISNTIYSRYNGTSNTLSNFYVVVEPAEDGGYHHIYKCIDNNSSGYSTVKPTLLQSETFETADGYKWRYISSVSSVNFNKFATDTYIPVISNNAVVANAYYNSGVEVVLVSNSGSGYDAYHSGNVQSFQSNTVVQISNNASAFSDYYTNNAILVYETGGEPTSGQLRTITKYVANSTGKWVYTSSNLVNDFISPAYTISPRVVFDTDGDVEPQAYTTINAVTNSIANVVMIEYGHGVTRANTTITSNSTHITTAAEVYSIVPPIGGHGSNPADELRCEAFAISFAFANTEGSNIPVDVKYNKVGIVRDPKTINSDATKNAATYSNTIFSALLKANVSSTFTAEDTLTGQTSGAVGTVAFANSTQVFLTGDKHFANGETIMSSDGLTSSTIDINTRGHIHTKSVLPLFVENIDTVDRSGVQAELFNIIVKV